MRLHLFILLSGLLLTGAGCWQPFQPTVLLDQPLRKSVNLEGEMKFEAITINREFILNEVAQCRLAISYPSFENDNFNATVIIQTQARMANFIAVALGQGSETVQLDELEDMADVYLAQCRLEIESEYQQLASTNNELFVNLKRNLDIVYNVTLNQNGLISLGLESYVYSGGAHPTQNSLYLSVDADQGHVLTFGDLITAEHLKVFMQYEKAQLLLAHQDDLYPEAITSFETLVNDQRPMSTEAQATAYGQQHNFYLTPTAIVTYYNSYDIAPYAAGPLFVEIPYTEVLDYLNLNGRLLPLLDKLEQT